MVSIEIFHGSEAIRVTPVYGAGRRNNDYGRGFYCTESLDLAKEWACAEMRGGFANRYALDMQGLRVMRLNSPEYHILNWLAILLENRTFDLKTPIAVQTRNYILEHFLPDFEQYDVIIGYRADDSYFSFARAFLENGISLEQLQRAMHLGKLGEQIVLKSSEAFDCVCFMEAVPAVSTVYHPRRLARDRQAREGFVKILEETPGSDAVFAVDILRQKWQNDDTRLR